MILRPTPLPTERLTYSRGVLACEASDLPRPGRVFDDACDVGYTLVSHRTRAERVVVAHGSARDGEGDLLYTDFVPAAELARIVRGAAPSILLRVFND